MFICEDCGHAFEKPYEWEERHGFIHGPFEKWSGCPICHEGYSEASMCDICGKWTPIEKLDIITNMADGDKIMVCSACNFEVD